jgi:hypothetical protein
LPTQQEYEITYRKATSLRAVFKKGEVEKMADDVEKGRCDEVGVTDSESSDDEDEDSSDDEDSAGKKDRGLEEDSDDEKDGQRPASNPTGGNPITVS